MAAAAAGDESDETVRGCAGSARSTRSTEEVRLGSGLPRHTAVCGNQDTALSGFTQFSFHTSLSAKREVKTHGHHNTGKSILLKPCSRRSSQYVLLLTHVSLLDFLQRTHAD